MTDIAAFLTARLDEEAETARRAEHPAGPDSLSWRPGGTRRLRFDNGRDESYLSVFCGDWDRVLVARDGVIGNVSAHIARQDPRATLDRVQATKAVVAMHQRHVSDVVTTPAFCDCCPWPFPCPTLRALASAYRRHPDYDPAWAPEGVTATTGG